MLEKGKGEKKKTDSAAVPVEKTYKSEKKEAPGITLKMNKESLTLGVLIVLVAVAGVQTVSLSKLSSGTASAAPVSAAASTSTTTATDSAALPSSLSNLPSQVGGC